MGWWPKALIIQFGITYLGYMVANSARKPFSVVKSTLKKSVEDGGLGMTPEDLANIDTVFLATYAIGMFLFVSLAERLGIVRVLSVTFIGSAVCCLVFGMLSNNIAMIIVWGLNGFLQSISYPLMMKLMIPWVPPSSRGSSMGIWNTSQQVGSFASTAFAAYIVEAINWRWSFYIPAIIVGVVGVLMFFIMKEIPPPSVLEFIETTEAEFAPPTSVKPDEDQLSAINDLTINKTNMESTSKSRRNNRRLNNNSGLPDDDLISEQSSMVGSIVSFNNVLGGFDPASLMAQRSRSENSNLNFEDQKDNFFPPSRVNDDDDNASYNKNRFNGRRPSVSFAVNSASSSSSADLPDFDIEALQSDSSEDEEVPTFEVLPLEEYFDENVNPFLSINDSNFVAPAPSHSSSSAIRMTKVESAQEEFISEKNSYALKLDYKAAAPKVARPFRNSNNLPNIISTTSSRMSSISSKKNTRTDNEFSSNSTSMALRQVRQASTNSIYKRQHANSSLSLVSIVSKQVGGVYVALPTSSLKKPSATASFFAQAMSFDGAYVARPEEYIVATTTTQKDIDEAMVFAADFGNDIFIPHQSNNNRFNSEDASNDNSQGDVSRRQTSLSIFKAQSISCLSVNRNLSMNNSLTVREGGGNENNAALEAAAEQEEEIKIQVLTFLDIIKGVPFIIHASLSYFFVKLVRYVMINWLAYYLADLEYSESTSGYLSMLFDLGGVLGSIAGGVLTDRVFKMGGATSAAMCLFCAGAIIFFSETASLGTGILVVSMLLVGFGIAGPDALLGSPIAADLCEMSVYGSAALGPVAGIINGMGSVGAIAQSHLVTAVESATSWRVVYIMLAIFCLVAAACMLPPVWRFYRQKMKKKKLILQREEEKRYAAEKINALSREDSQLNGSYEQNTNQVFESS